MTRAEAQTKIDEIDTILCGPTRVVINGRQVDYDFEALERTRARLQRYVNGGVGLRVVRYNPDYTG